MCSIACVCVCTCVFVWVHVCSVPIHTWIPPSPCRSRNSLHYGSLHLYVCLYIYIVSLWYIRARVPPNLRSALSSSSSCVGIQTSLILNTTGEKIKPSSRIMYTVGTVVQRRNKMFKKRLCTRFLTIHYENRIYANRVRIQYNIKVVAVCVCVLRVVKIALYRQHLKKKTVSCKTKRENTYFYKSNT